MRLSLAAVVTALVSVSSAEEPTIGESVPPWQGGDDAAFRAYVQEYAAALGGWSIRQWAAVKLDPAGGRQRFAALCGPGGESAHLVDVGTRAYLWREGVSPDC